jgi:hypothetical protein
MPILEKTGHAGTITWLGRVPDRDASLRAVPAQRLEATLAGLDGEWHGGLTRPSCSRVTMLHPRGTTIRNTRQITILSAEELDRIAAAMELPALDPALVGANIVTRGIPDLTHLPPGSRLQAPSGATLVVDLENRPCHLPVPEIDAEAPGHGRAFKPAAADRRGLTAWVERPGALAVGEALTLFIPGQRAWNPAEAPAPREPA